MFESLRHDFNSRKRERCVRLDLPSAPGRGSVAGLDELERHLKEAVKASFEARAAAYDEEVRLGGMLIYPTGRTLQRCWILRTMVLGKQTVGAAMLLCTGGGPS